MKLIYDLVVIIIKVLFQVSWINYINLISLFQFMIDQILMYVALFLRSANTVFIRILFRLILLSDELST